MASKLSGVTGLPSDKVKHGVSLRVDAVLVVPSASTARVKRAADGGDAMKTSVTKAFDTEGVQVKVIATEPAENAPLPTSPPSMSYELVPELDATSSAWRVHVMVAIVSAFALTFCVE